jgi:hypothetical protein
MAQDSWRCLGFLKTRRSRTIHSIPVSRPSPRSPVRLARSRAKPNMTWTREGTTSVVPQEVKIDSGFQPLAELPSATGIVSAIAIYRQLSLLRRGIEFITQFFSY